MNLFRVDKNSTVYQIIALLIIGGLALAARFWANGLSFNLDYGIFQPDGSHYTYRALTFAGTDSSAAARMVVEWYQLHGIRHNSFTPEFLLPSNTTAWSLVSPRLIYPILSVPFVWLMGINGMLIIPILAYFGFILIVYILARHFKTPWLGIFLAFVFTVSNTFMRWMVANLTDGLQCFLFACLVYILLCKRDSRLYETYLSSLILLTSLNRFALPIWIAIALVMFIQKRIRVGVLVITISLLTSLPTFYASRLDVSANANVSAFHGIGNIVVDAFKVLFIEVAELAILDRILLLLILIAFGISVMNHRLESSQYFLGTTLGVWCIGAINGTLGVNFRYQLPLLGFVAWVLLRYLSEFGQGNLRNFLNIVRGESKQ